MRKLMTSSFVRQELTDDPAKYLQSLHVPMLAIVRTNDRIVPAAPYVAMRTPWRYRAGAQTLESRVVAD